jgi:tetratricopeptide (TPR) repeat protein
VRLALVNRCLNVPAAPESFKIHDLINTYVRRHDDEAVRRRHCELAGYYQASPYFDTDLRLARLAAGHCATSRDPDILSAYYVRVAERLRTAGAASELRGLTEAAMLLRRSLPAQEADSVRADLGWSLAQMGETAEALSVLSKLLAEIGGRGLDVDPLRRASLIRQIADCRRLRGDVVGAERDLRDAAADLQARGLGETTEGIACRLDYAHCGYLAARPRDSLDRLLDIKSVCEQTQFAAEWWYRFSKTQRQLWNVDEAVTAARRCMTLAHESGSALANVKGRWAELAAQRLSVPVCDCNQSAEILAECAEVKHRFGELGYRAAIFVRHDIADLRRMSGDHELAAEEFRRIRELTRAMGETNREAHSWLGEAECVRAAAGGLGKVGGAEHLALYEQARSRYQAMDNLWGTAVSRFGLRVARGEEIRTTAAATLGEPCCTGEQRLVSSGEPLFPLNFV